MKVLITGNREKDLCSEIVPLLEKNGFECECVSRSNGYDFEKDAGGVIHRVGKLAESADVFINLYANYFFNGTILAQKIYNRWLDQKAGHKRMINVGSTTDRVKRGKNNLYHYEKLILRDWSSGHSLIGVWEGGPKVTHISYGTLSNRSDNNPGRKCLEMKKAAEYILWILQQPADININEISIDPIQ
ncbi:MAG: hypothetical protein HRT44_06715 [Bdellovibrionales bacterium]|nr:hypothetical protein [Bdellovibrionales bacterium]NQZ18931.1 hypothetical protein [Bdellovibrionales bacterium]